MDNKTDNKKKNDLNIFLYLLLIFIILQHIGKIFDKIGLLLSSQNKFFYVDKNVVLYSIILSVAIIIVIIGTMCKKKWGVIGFFCIQIVNLIGIQVLSTEEQDIGLNILVTSIISIVFALFLLLRSNGQSAWKVIFGKSESKQRGHTSMSLLKIVGKLKTNRVGKIRYKEVHDEKEKTLGDTSSLQQEILEKAISTTCPKENIADWPEKKNTKVSNKFKWTLKLRLEVVSVLVVVSTSVGLYVFYRHCTNNEYLMNKANENFVKGDIKNALEIYEELASDKDYVPAKTKLGYLYLVNDSVPLDTVRGLNYLREASVTDSTAMEYLLKVYMGAPCKGEDLTNIEKSKYYAEKAIEKRILMGFAYFCLGNYFSEKEDLASAYYNWEKSSQYKFADAFNNLGWMFYNGNGCDVDMNKSYRYFQRALEIDPENGYTLYYIGLFYLNGDVVKQDKLKARDYFKKAADLGEEAAAEEYSKIQWEYKLSDFSL